MGNRFYARTKSKQKFIERWNSQQNYIEEKIFYALYGLLGIHNFDKKLDEIAKEHVDNFIDSMDKDIKMQKCVICCFDEENLLFFTYDFLGQKAYWTEFGLEKPNREDVAKAWNEKYGNDYIIVDDYEKIYTLEEFIDAIDM